MFPRASQYPPGMIGSSGSRGMARPAAADELVDAHEVQPRQRLILEAAQRDVRGLDVLPARGQVRAVLQRVADRTFQVDRFRLRRRAIHGIDGCRPQLVVGAADNQPLQRQFAVAQNGLGVDELLPPGRFLRLGLHDVDRRHRADFHAHLVIGDQLRRQFQRALRRLDGLVRKDQLPVRVAHLRDGARHRRPQIEIRDLLLDGLRLELRARVVDLEVLEDRLVVLDTERRAERRIEQARVSRREVAVVVERDRVVAAAPGHVLLDTGVPHLRVRVDDQAAFHARGGQLRLRVVADRRRQQRPVRRARGGDGVVERARGQPLRRERKVPVQRARHRFVCRQVHRRALNRRLDLDAFRRGLRLRHRLLDQGFHVLRRRWRRCCCCAAAGAASAMERTAAIRVDAVLLTKCLPRVDGR